MREGEEKEEEEGKKIAGQKGIEKTRRSGIKEKIEG